MGVVSTPITVFTDANTMLDNQAIRQLVKHYTNPAVGGVAGEKKVMAKGTETAGVGEGLYWKYESWLKKQDWLLFSVVGAAGELFSVRSALYRSPGADAILDDFIISLKVCELGYRFAYEPSAFAMELPSANLKEERKRKVRISAGAFQAIWRMRSLLNVFAYPVLSFQYISHRVLRWTLCPLAFLTVLVSNVALVATQAGPIFSVFLGLQGFVYALAAIGWLIEKTGSKAAWGKVPKLAYYFMFIQVSVFLGFFRFLKGRQTVLWERAHRSSASVMQA
jgi:cellulose synthase/poly-beta-1,6-N-acetylglucosamine synthase-like glycosyltransferase